VVNVQDTLHPIVISATTDRPGTPYTPNDTARSHPNACPATALSRWPSAEGVGYDEPVNSFISIWWPPDGGP
jgi:hypothetical protein